MRLRISMTALASALKDRPELVRAAAQTDSQRAGLSLAKLQRLPLPDATLSYQRGYGDSSFDSQWEIGVGLTLNVFDGGATAADERSARARLDSLLLATDQTKKDISTEIEQAYLNYGNALERLAASKPNVTLAQQNVEVAREKYAQGLGIPLEITTAEISYADAQANHAPGFGPIASCRLRSLTRLWEEGTTRVERQVQKQIDLGGGRSWSCRGRG